MPSIGRRVAGGVTILVALSGAPLVAGEATPPEVILHLDNRADVPAGDLARARAEVERVFREAGVGVAWDEGRLTVAVSGLNGAGEPRHAAVLLVNNHDGPTRGAKGCALGVALPAMATAYVYYNRIVDTSLRGPVDVPIALGRVMAHEFGHLLLPRGHSSYGIMRADLDLGYANPAGFSDEQIQQIRAALAVRSTLASQ